jgi:hypothetical protein
MVSAWERFRGLAYGIESGFKDWMLIHLFYSGLENTCKTYLDNQSGGSIMNLTSQNAFVMLDGFLIEVKIIEVLKKPKFLRMILMIGMKFLNYIIRKRKWKKLNFLVKLGNHSWILINVA